MTGNEIRETFLRFFEERGHRRVRSSSLVPANDPTLLFTNAGMNQFKDVFLGLEQRDYKRATTCQKCVRAGGKHNDLENVGFTNRHHTFFEMLGNFSFGDYFKKDAIAYAWELVTSPKWFALPKDKLYVTIFKGEQGVARDSEAYDHWLGQGVAKERIYEFGVKDNFWAMGDTGPCGPCSEIFYDMGPAASDAGHTDCQFGCECGRYVEIWNLVFMQFNRDTSGTLNPLPKPSVDTGAGLERVTAVLQGKVSNFDTDLFVPLISLAGKILQYVYASGNPNHDASLRIIADHARAATFLVNDGVLPSNEGRGYVLRKIIRRAIRHGRLLGHNKPFLYSVAQEVVRDYGLAYPELAESSERISNAILAEEHRFGETFNHAVRQFDHAADHARVRFIDAVLDGLPTGNREVRHAYQNYLLPGNTEADKILAANTISPGHLETILERTKRIVPKLDGKEAFQLWDTFGLARDFIEDLSRDSGIEFDGAGFETALEEQRSRARASWKGGSKEAAPPLYLQLAEYFKTEPAFYFGTVAQDCRIEAIVKDNVGVSEIIAGEEAEVILDRTSIYAESGGQVADTGSFFDNGQSLELATVKGAYYPVSGLIAHRIIAKETLRRGDRVSTVANPIRRARNRRNHTGTHLVHAALRNILGAHVKQAGSLVAPDHLRFDFSHYAAVDPSEIADIEQQVNGEIIRNAEIQTDQMNIDAALASGALAFFGDKYPEHNVRVVTIPDTEYARGFYSKELCGGTHVTRSGEIGVFKIIDERSSAAGVRRIDAITGDTALSQFQRFLGTHRKIASLLNAGEDGVLEAVERQAQIIRHLEKQLADAKRKSAVSGVDSLLESSREIKGVKVLASTVAGVDREALRQLVDTLRQKMGSGVVILGTAEDSKVALIAGVTKDLTSKVHAGKLIQELARQVGGSGGGRPDLAEAGGKDTAGLETAISGAYTLVERML